jgi:CRISPR-associated RAMP protein (TIGR02581 family)
MPAFERRFLFTGRLKTTTGLHVGGGGYSLSPTDSPVIRGPDMKPFIPGSSLKGSFRSTVEKLAPAVELSSCALIEDAPCPGAPGIDQKQFNKRREEENWNEAKLMIELDQSLCDTCKLFGSPYQASKIRFDDLEILDWPGTTQIRDGVAINRDSEKAVDRLKYDYEVVPPDTAFDFRITLEEPTDHDLGLACIGLSEFAAGLAGLGGKRSSGLGRCVLEEPKVYVLDLRNPATRAQRLRRYLLGSTPEEKMELEPDFNAFLQAPIADLIRR